MGYSSYTVQYKNVLFILYSFIPFIHSRSSLLNFRLWHHKLFSRKRKENRMENIFFSPEFAKCFSKLGRDFPPSDDLVNELNKFACLMYGDKTSTNVNECRYELLNRRNVQTMRCLQLVIALSNISTEQTFKQHHGVNVWVQKLIFHHQLVMVGRLTTTTSWRLPGLHDRLLHNHWSSVLNASAKLAGLRARS